MAQNYTFLCRIKTLTILKVAKFDNFNEFRSFCVSKEIGIARIVVSLQCHKHDMKASFEYTGYYPFWLLFMYPYVKVVEKMRKPSRKKRKIVKKCLTLHFSI